MENEFETIGTVLSYTGNKGKLIIGESNLKNKKVRVIVTLVNAKKEKLRCVLSRTLSDDFREGTVTAGNLMTLEYGEGDNGVMYIVRPAGAVKEIEVKDLDITEIKAVEFNIEDYITL